MVCYPIPPNFVDYSRGNKARLEAGGKLFNEVDLIEPIVNKAHTKKALFDTKPGFAFDMIKAFHADKGTPETSSSSIYHLTNFGYIDFSLPIFFTSPIIDTII